MIDWDSCVLWLDSRYFSESYWWDRSKYANNGIVYGAKFKEEGFYFDSDDYVKVADNNTLDITDEITIEALVKPNGHQDNYTMILDKYSTLGYAFELMNSDVLRFYAKIGGTGQGFNSSEIVTINEKNHIMVTYNGSDGEFFINGKSGGTFTPSPDGEISSNNYDLYIGYPISAGKRYKGNLYFIRLYKKSFGLNEAKILARNAGF